MKITYVNNLRVYVPEAKDVNLEITPSYLSIASKTWKQGEKKNSLSVDEMNQLKNKYNFKNMSEKDMVDFMGELVEAGVVDASSVVAMYDGRLIPVDASQTGGVLTKCDPVMEARCNRLRNGYGDIGGIRAMLSAGGIESYRNWYEYTKLKTTVNVGESEFFQSAEKLLEIFQWMSRA